MSDDEQRVSGLPSSESIANRNAAAAKRRSRLRMQEKEELYELAHFEKSTMSSNRGQTTYYYGEGNDDDDDDDDDKKPPKKEGEGSSGCDGPVNLKCCYCDTWYTSLEQMEEHLATKHSGQPVKCPFCEDYWCPTLESLQVHMQQSHGRST